MQPPDAELDCLEQFYRLAMPAAVRKLRQWQGLSRTHHSDLVDDLAQEVAADFVAHRATLEAMPRDARHERWLRLLGRSHYRLRGRELASAQRTDTDVDKIAIEVEEMTQQRPPLPSSDAKFAAAVLQHGVHLKNGRLNELITAHSIGLTPLQFRRRGEQLVAALQGTRVIEFWRRRLVEALLGLAADVLRDRACVLICGEGTRNRPDPHARLQRVLRIRERLRFLPVDIALRRVLLRYGKGRRDLLDPHRALDSALELAPRAPHAHLWRFELAVARADLARAAQALRMARACGADAVAVVLARARLLEVRGHEAAARALLRRARQRVHDARLDLSLTRLCAAACDAGAQTVRASG
jgi:hypothetical protein